MQLYTKQSLERLIKPIPETINSLQVLARVNRLHKKPHAHFLRLADKLAEILCDYQTIMEDLEDGTQKEED